MNRSTMITLRQLKDQVKGASPGDKTGFPAILFFHILGSLKFSIHGWKTNMYQRSDYLYDLPEELIAQTPVDNRETSRLLVYDRKSATEHHKSFKDILEFLRRGDVLVVNDTRVIPARMYVKRQTGGQTEVLLLREVEPATWECLVRPAKRIRTGEILEAEGDRTLEVLEEGDEGKRIIRFAPADGFQEWLERIGEPPLPPYIRRAPEREDWDRYQTVYAKNNGAVAAPTAGLHFTEELLDKLRNMGVNVVSLTLHVGIGTFRPVSVENILEHKMDAEVYEVSSETAAAINDARKNGGRIFAVGTTVVRTLETLGDDNGMLRPGTGETSIFIHPPYEYKMVDALITNFHLPGSTLIMLVSALAGRENVLKLYREAVERKYRFFSYGDAMLIL